MTVSINQLSAYSGRPDRVNIFLRTLENLLESIPGALAILELSQLINQEKPVPKNIENARLLVKKGLLKALPLKYKNKVHPLNSNKAKISDFDWSYPEGIESLLKASITVNPKNPVEIDIVNPINGKTLTPSAKNSKADYSNNKGIQAETTAEYIEEDRKRRLHEAPGSTQAIPVSEIVAELLKSLNLNK